MSKSTKLLRPPGILLSLNSGFASYSVTDKLRALMFFYFCAFMSFGALVWLAICFLLGEFEAMLIPGSYLLATVLNLLLSGQTAGNNLGVIMQLILSIALPFVFQYQLGGIINSGGVMLWSVLALLGSITFQRGKEIFAWAILFVIGVVVCFYYEAAYFSRYEPEMPYAVACINLVLVSLIIFGLAHFFTGLQERLQLMIANKKRELQDAQDLMKQDLSLAKDFQHKIHSGDLVPGTFSEKLVISESKNVVNGNFHWQAEFLNVDVTVFVENPHEGVRASMETMMLISLIERLVSRPEVQSPQTLIEFLQRELYSKYKDVPEIQKSIEDFKLSVLAYDKRKCELSYASIDSVIINQDSSRRVILCGFDNESRDTYKTASGEVLVIGKMYIGPGSKLVMSNKAMLGTLGITDDTSLLGKSKLDAIMDWEFDIGKADLKKAIERNWDGKDLFLLALKF